MDWWIAPGAAALLFVGLVVGILGTRLWKRERGELPRIRRNRLVWQIFQWLVIVLGIAIAALILAAWAFVEFGKGASEFIQGIVLTALAGAIASILSFLGLIVKGLLDELRDGENDGPTN